MSTKEIDGKIYMQVPAYSGKVTEHAMNEAYLEQLPPSELIWHIETALHILKEKAVKIELPAE